MKLKTLVMASFVAAAGLSQAAITVSIKNFTAVNVGVPIVSATGVPLATNSFWASAGIFTTEPNWATASASSIVAAFTAIDATPLTNGTFTGLFTGNDTTTLSAYATGFDGATPYILVGNNSNLSLSTLVAVYKATGTVYQTPVAGVANTAVNGTDPTKWVYGIARTVSTQPSLGSANFTNGIQLTTVPEPSVALLGALGVLGLLRRRRN